MSWTKYKPLSFRGGSSSTWTTVLILAAVVVLLAVIVVACAYKLKVVKLKQEMRSQGLEPGSSRGHLDSTR